MSDTFARYLKGQIGRTGRTDHTTPALKTCMIEPASKLCYSKRPKRIKKTRYCLSDPQRKQDHRRRLNDADCRRAPFLPVNETMSYGLAFRSSRCVLHFSASMRCLESAQGISTEIDVDDLISDVNFATLAQGRTSKDAVSFGHAFCQQTCTVYCCARFFLPRRAVC